jgi:hypothetical protein
LDLAPIIRELILHNECIILPGLGGFETEYLPAQYLSERGIIMPPSKKISLRSDYLTGGEILKKHLIEKLFISDENASKIISDYVLEIKSTISAKKTYEIKDVGTLSSDITGNIIFTPAKEENYLADSFGLEPLPFKAKTRRITKPEEKIPLLKIRERRNTLTFIIVGIIVISILLAATIIISAQYDLYLFNIGNRHTTNDMLIIGGSMNLDSVSAKIDSKIDESTSIKKALSYSGQKQSPVKNNQTTERHYLIAGSFDNIKNASDLEKRLTASGFKPEVVQVEGMYRVCVGIFTDKPAALEELQRIRRQMSHPVWLLSSEK